MTTVPRRRPALDHACRRAPQRPAPPLFEPGGPTLDDRISTLWGELAETGRGDCPVCRAEIVAGGECDHCGSELS